MSDERDPASRNWQGSAHDPSPEESAHAPSGEVDDPVSPPPPPVPAGPSKFSKGDRVGEHVLEERLSGKGAEVDSWRAFHPVHGATFVKVPQRPFLPADDSAVGYTARKELFEIFEHIRHQMRDSLSHLSVGDGALVAPLEVGRIGVGPVTRLFVATQWCEGAVDGKELRRADLEARVVFIRGFLLGIRQLHRRGFVHGDVKPDNVLIVPSGRGLVARLIDFDNGYVTGTRIDKSLLGGDPGYMSPERLRVDSSTAPPDMVLTCASDVFSLSLVLHFLLTGDSVGWSSGRGDAARRVLDGSTPRWRGLGVGLPRLDAALVRCLDPEPNRRPTIEQLVVASGVHIAEPVGASR